MYASNVYLYASKKVFNGREDALASLEFESLTGHGRNLNYKGLNKEASEQYCIFPGINSAT